MEYFPPPLICNFVFQDRVMSSSSMLRLLPLKIMSLPGATSPYVWVPAMNYAKVSLGPQKLFQNLIPIAGGIRGDLGSEWVTRVLPVTCQTAWMCAGGFVSSALATREFGNKVLSWKQISNILPWLWSSQSPELGEINFYCLQITQCHEFLKNTNGPRQTEGGQLIRNEHFPC